MTVTSPETSLRTRLKAALDAEFEPEGVTFLDDKLDDSRGTDGACGGVYPGPSEPKIGQEQVLQVTAYVQLFGAWEAKVDPNLSIDPTPIEEWAERLRRAVEADEPEGGADVHLWYYTVTRIEYPPDPSGNITRLLATVTGTAQNPALVPTAG